MTDQSLLMDFIAETGEHLEQIEKGLLALEQDPADREVLNDIFRSVHTIKGSSEYLGMSRIAELTHKLENLLDDIRQDRRSVNDGLIDLLMAAGDRIGLLIEDLDRGQSEQAPVDDLLEQIESLGGEQEAAEQVEAEDEVADEGVDLGEEVSGSEQEIYQEEYDEELFGIFIDQLSEGLTGVIDQCRAMCTGEVDEEVVSGCIESLEALRSSANYMGYEKLKEVYDEWLEAVREAGTLVGEGGHVDWRQVAEETMLPMLNKVTGFFGKIEKIEEICKQIEEKPVFSENIDIKEKEIVDDDLDVEGINQEEDITEEELELDLEFEEEKKDEEETEGEKGYTTEPETDQSLLMDFIAETGEHLEQIEKGLLALEQDPADREVLNDIFRSVHTIKGSSEYLGMSRIAELTHKLENLLDDIRQDRRSVNDGLIDLLMAAGDRIGLLIEDLDRGQSEQAPVDDLLEQIESLGGEQEAAEQVEAEDEVADEGVDLGEEVSGSEQEIYQEEYDEELFGIFIDQLSEGLTGVIDQCRAMCTGEVDEEVVSGCIESLEALRSSANYMGYEKLKEVYDEWLEAVREAGTLVGEGGHVDWRQVAEETMLPMLHKVTGFFSKIEKINDLGSSIQSLADSGYSEHEASATENDTVINTEAESTVSLEDLGIDIESPDFEIDIPDVASEEEDQELISRLENALDERLDALQTTEDQDIVEDMENGLFSTEDILQQIESEPDYNKSLEEIDDIESELFSDDTAETAQEELPDSTDKEEPIADKDQIKTVEEAGKQEEAALPHVDDGDRRSRFSLGRRRADKIKEKLLKHSIRVDAAKIDTLMNQVGELVVSRAWFSQLFNEMRELQQELNQTQKLDQKELKHVKELTLRISEATTALGRVANELQEGVMRVRMLPIEQLFSRYPRLVHDLVRGSGKKVHLEIVGEETELDKVVIEEIADPLVHILRNAIDHGLESPKERLAGGKPETGTLRLQAYHESNHVVIEISDDGRGIDIDLVKAKALEKQFVTGDELERMSEKEILALIMQPGFSTAQEVTHTSGRGVGMDVVKANIEKLNGTLEIDSQKGLGSRFKIKIPLTLAIIPALLVKVSGDLFTIPLSTVDETLRVYKNEISTIEGIDVFQLRETTIPLVKLSELFDMPTVPSKDDRIFVVVVNTGVKRVGLVVDELRGREEVVIKPLEDYLQENSGFSGATILGDGSISLILDIYELFNLSVEKQAKKKAVATPL